MRNKDKKKIKKIHYITIKHIIIMKKLITTENTKDTIFLSEVTDDHIMVLNDGGYRKLYYTFNGLIVRVDKFGISNTCHKSIEQACKVWHLVEMYITYDFQEALNWLVNGK